MKKINYLLIVAVILLTGCSSNIPKKYTIYTDFSQSYDSGDVYKSKISENITIGNINDVNFTVSERHIVKNEAALTKTLNLSSASFNLKHRESYMTDISSSSIAHFSACGYTDVYEYIGESGTAEAHFRKDSGELLFWFTTFDTPETEKILSEEETERLAEKTIGELYGENTLEEYVRGNFYSNNDDVCIVYHRYVHGYKTDDRIQIWFYHSGDVKSVNALKFGFFKNAEKDISKSSIIDAHNALLDSIDKAWTAFEPTLTVDSSGAYFLNVRASRITSNGEQQSAEFYINVN